MNRWKPKRGPVLTVGRAAHAVTGAILVGLGGAIDGYSGLPVGMVLAVALGLAWELSTPGLARRFGWSHHEGDVEDLAAYMLGAALAGIGWQVWVF